MPGPVGAQPETPRYHLSVALALRVARTIRRNGLTTPHSCGGTAEDRVRYEYEGATRFLDNMAEHLPKEFFKDRDVLDVGCGWGGKLIYYSEHTGMRSIKGFDLPGYDLAVACEFAASKGVANCEFHHGDAERIAYGDGTFDIVITEDVLEHVQTPLAVVAECHRVLKAGGTLIAIFPSFKQANAHHLDRAINLPGLHYLLSMKTWASGLNYYLRASDSAGPGWTAFLRVVRTPYSTVTSDLNGMGFTDFEALVRETDFEMQILKLVPRAYGEGRPLFRRAYDFLYRLPFLREFLADHIIFIGRKPSLSS